MSLKLIELQIALPRTHDAGKMQNELQQKGQMGQQYLANDVNKKQERQRKQVSESEKSAKNKLKKEASDGRNSSLARIDILKQQEEHEHIKHPYKGTYLDIEG